MYNCSNGSLATNEVLRKATLQEKGYPPPPPPPLKWSRTRCYQAVPWSLTIGLDQGTGSYISQLVPEAIIGAKPLECLGRDTCSDTIL